MPRGSELCGQVLSSSSRLVQFSCCSPNANQPTNDLLKWPPTVSLTGRYSGLVEPTGRQASTTCVSGLSWLASLWDRADEPIADVWLSIGSSLICATTSQLLLLSLLLLLLLLSLLLIPVHLLTCRLTRHNRRFIQCCWRRHRRFNH